MASYVKKKDIIEKAPFWATPSGNHLQIPGSGNGSHFGALYQSGGAGAVSVASAFDLRNPVAAPSGSQQSSPAGGGFAGGGTGTGSSGPGTGGSSGTGKIFTF